MNQNAPLTDAELRDRVLYKLLKYSNDFAEGLKPNDEQVADDIMALITSRDAALVREAKIEEAKEICAIFDMSEWKPTGTMMDEHMFSRSKEEIAVAKQYNFDHAWAAMSAQKKINAHIEQLQQTATDTSEQEGEAHV